MPLDCDLTCGDYSVGDWMEFSPVEQSFLEYCATSTGPVDPVAPTEIVELLEEIDASIDALPTTPPAFGTSTHTAAIAEAGTPVVIPTGWSSWAVIAPVSNTGNGSLDGSSVLLPGVSFGHQAWEGYPGVAITVSATGADIVLVSYVVPS